METAQPSPDDSSVVQPPADPGPAPADPGPPPSDLGPPSGRGDASPWPQQDVTLPRVRVSGPADMLAVVPHLLGSIHG
jgi:hypothetical protein